MIDHRVISRPRGDHGAADRIASAVKIVKARQLAASGEARRRRLDAGLSYQETADAVGVSAATIFRWERSERAPHGETAVRYFDLLDALAHLTGLGTASSATPVEP